MTFPFQNKVKGLGQQWLAASSSLSYHKIIYYSLYKHRWAWFTLGLLGMREVPQGECNILTAILDVCVLMLPVTAAAVMKTQDGGAKPLQITKNVFES